MAEAKIKKACKDLSLPLKPSATKVRPETGCKFARDLDKDIAMDSSTRVVVAVSIPSPRSFLHRNNAERLGRPRSGSPIWCGNRRPALRWPA